MKIKRNYLIVIGLILLFSLLMSSIFLYDKINENKDSSNHYVLYIGLNDKNENTQLLKTSEAQEIVDNTTLKYVDGFTTTLAKGHWSDGKVMFNETTIICYIDDTDIGTVHKLANDLKKKLNQESILIEESFITKEFY